MPEFEPGHEQPPQPATTEEEMRQRFQMWLPKAEMSPPEQQRLLIKEIQKAGEALFSKTAKRAAAFTALLERLTHASYENTETMLASMAKETCAFMNTHFTNKDNLESERRELRRTAAEAAGQHWLNDAIAYGTGDHLIHVHVADLHHLPVTNRALLMRSGLRKLAGVVAADPTVETVIATSSLVADPETAPGIEAAGFRILGPISDEERAAHFADDKRPISRAIMTREEFLTKWGQKTPAK